MLVQAAEPVEHQGSSFLKHAMARVLMPTTPLGSRLTALAAGLMTTRALAIGAQLHVVQQASHLCCPLGWMCCVPRAAPVSASMQTTNSLARCVLQVSLSSPNFDIYSV